MKSLNIIYHFQASHNQEEEFSPASYRMLYIFDEETFIDSSIILELLKAFPDSNFQDKTFLNLDDLKAFALRVAQEVGASEVRLISVQDYNIGIDGAKDLKSYREIFSKYGESVISEHASKKKGFLGKFFS